MLDNIHSKEILLNAQSYPYTKETTDIKHGIAIGVLLGSTLCGFYMVPLENKFFNNFDKSIRYVWYNDEILKNKKETSWENSVLHLLTLIIKSLSLMF